MVIQEECTTNNPENERKIFKKLIPHILSDNKGIMSDKMRKVFIIPRKSLSKGESSRITIRISSDVEQILSLIDSKRKSPFVRDAILYYAKFGNSPDLSPKTYSKQSSQTYNVSDEKYNEAESAPIVVVNKPAWQR